MKGKKMELNFNYTAQLLSFCEILALSAVLSVVVMYIVEMLKKIILTTNSRIFTLLCFVISMAFGYLWAKTFAKEAINTSYALWYNKCKNRVGYVFRNRYHIQIIESQQHLFNCLVYIVPYNIGPTQEQALFYFGTFRPKVISD